VAKPRPRTLLILSQVYVPDPAAVGQHMADVGAEMVRRGWRVRVLAAGRGYHDAGIRYKAREVIDGVEVRRLPLSSFGKRFFPLRVLASVLFVAQVTVRRLLARGVDCILVSTSPPMCFIAVLFIRVFRRIPVKFWVMDINPDQLVAVGKARRGSVPVKVMDFFNRWMLRSASDVVQLDRFMAAASDRKFDASAKSMVIPPWALEEHVAPVPHEQNPFRREHGLDGKFVFMYSGNHGFALPLETFLRAAARFKDDPRAMFVFIGDGVRKKEVLETIEEHRMPNMVSLPYQPLETLKYSLSAADVHLVSIGNELVGVQHPCKTYGAMAVARPILLIGPDPCHISEQLHEHGFGWHIPHGDVDGCERTIREIMGTPRERLEEMGRRGRALIDGALSKRVLCGRFCDVVERGGLGRTGKGR